MTIRVLTVGGHHRPRLRIMRQTSQVADLVVVDHWTTVRRKVPPGVTLVLVFATSTPQLRQAARLADESGVRLVRMPMRWADARQALLDAGYEVTP